MKKQRKVFLVETREEERDALLLLKDLLALADAQVGEVTVHSSP